MFWTRSNAARCGWIVAVVMGLMMVGPTGVYAGSGHHGGGHGGHHSGHHGGGHGGFHAGGHHGGGHGGLHLGSGHHDGSHAGFDHDDHGYHRYGYGHGYGYGYPGYGYGYGYGHPRYGYGYGYGYPYGSSYYYNYTYYRYPPIRNRYDDGGVYGGYPSYSDLSRSHVRVYYGGSHGSDSGDYDRGARRGPVYPSTVAGNDRGASVDGPGWKLLEDGRYLDALNRFASEAPARPRDGVPKIGYALSAALGGDPDVGVWAMRRAVRIDIGSLHRVRTSGVASTCIDRAVGLYESDYETHRPDTDKVFMLAVLYDLRGDVKTSRAKAREAIEIGDTSESAAALKRMLDEDYPKKPDKVGDQGDH